MLLFVMPQVKTTQPRRYLVRPNQGIIAPEKTAEVQILLVEKDKVALYQSFQRLGQAALDHCKDKFLVQSCFLGSAHSLSPDNYDALTEFWTKLSSNPGDASLPSVTNKKLTVLHTGIVTEGTPATLSSAPSANAGGTEIDQLKKKYDELVAFSVNLTAERDILNNTLEQTKRDLNRYMQKAAANENAGGSANAGDGSMGGASSSGFSPVTVLFLAVVFWLMGCYMQVQGQVSFLEAVPVIGEYFGASAESSSEEL
jgi:hypothetical protein